MTWKEFQHTTESHYQRKQQVQDKLKLCKVYLSTCDSRELESARVGVMRDGVGTESGIRLECRVQCVYFFCRKLEVSGSF